MAQFKYVELLFIRDSVLFNSVSDQKTLMQLLNFVKSQIPSAIMGEGGFKTYPISVIRFEKLQGRDWEIYQFLFRRLLYDEWEPFAVYSLSYITGSVQYVAPVHCFRKST